MSRAEKTPIIVPVGVTLLIEDDRVIVKGPRGQMEIGFDGKVLLTFAENRLSLAAVANTSQARAMVGTAKSLVNNMIEGVQKGFAKQLVISGVGFKAALKGSELNLSLGTSHPINYSIPEDIKVTVAEGVKLTVEGVDRQKVGQVAADIYSFYPMEPYKGKGVRIVGQFARRKAGKKTA